MARAAFRGKRQHRDARLGDAAELAGCRSRGDGDIGELLGVRAGIHHAVGIDEKPVFANLPVWTLHEEARRDELHAGRSLYYLQSRPQHVAGRMHRAGNKPVGVAKLDHHHAVVHRISRKLCGRLLSEPFRLAKLEQCSGVGIKLWLVGRSFDQILRKQDWFRDPFVTNDFRRRDRARLVALRQHNTLDALPRLCLDFIYQFHYSSPFTSLAHRQCGRRRHRYSRAFRASCRASWPLPRATQGRPASVQGSRARPRR